MANVWRCNKNKLDCYTLFQDGAEFIVFDTETTGLHPEKDDRIVEIGAVKVRSENKDLKIIDEMDILIKPPFPLSDKIVELTNITNVMLIQEKPEEEIFPKIYQFFGSDPVICGYNTPFDNDFLSALYKRNGESFNPYLLADILEMARDIIPMSEISDYKLSTVIETYGLNNAFQFHRAIDDTKATLCLLKIFYDEYQEKPIPERKLICPILKAAWYWEGYSRKQKAVYVRTTEGDILYNQYYRGWVSKDIPDFDKKINMEFVQSETLYRLGLSSINELQKMTKKKMDDARNNWYKKPSNTGLNYQF